MAISPELTAKSGQDGDTDLLALLQRVAGTGPLDVQAVRLLVEPYAAQSAASTASAADLAQIRETHLAASHATEMEQFERLDGEFHKRIFAASRNGLLTCCYDMLQIIRSQSAWVDIKRRSFSEARRLDYCAEHARIVEALFDRNPPAAAEAMRAHLHTVSSNLFAAEGGMGVMPPPI